MDGNVYKDQKVCLQASYGLSLPLLLSWMLKSIGIAIIYLGAR